MSLRALKQSRMSQGQRPRINSQGQWDWEDDILASKPDLLLNCRNLNVVEIQPTNERFLQSTTEIPLFQTNNSVLGDKIVIKQGKELDLEELKDDFVPSRMLDNNFTSMLDVQRGSTQITSNMTAAKSFNTIFQPTSHLRDILTKNSLEGSQADQLQQRMSFPKGLKANAEKLSSQAIRFIQKQKSEQPEGFVSMMNQFSYVQLASKEIDKKHSYLVIPEAPHDLEDSPAFRKRPEHQNREGLQFNLIEVIEEEKNNSSSNKQDQPGDDKESHAVGFRKIQSKPESDPIIARPGGLEINQMMHLPDNDDNIIHRAVLPNQAIQAEIEDDRSYNGESMPSVFDEYLDLQDEEGSQEKVPLFETKKKSNVDQK